MATIKEIAQRAGVSTTTVSNVIHGKTKKVSPANIQKIENLIREMGYVQKMGLRVLNKEKSQLIIKTSRIPSSEILFMEKLSVLLRNMCRSWVII